MVEGLEEKPSSHEFYDIEGTIECMHRLDLFYMHM